MLGFGRNSSLMYRLGSSVPKAGTGTGLSDGLA
jgi:hypothetical protein